MICNANILADELKHDDIHFSPNLDPNKYDKGDKCTKINFAVRVDNRAEGCFYIWDFDKFKNRVDKMKELAQQYKETGILPDFSDKKTDPFWDPPSKLFNTSSNFLQRKNIAKSRLDVEVKNTAELDVEVSGQEIDLESDKQSSE